MLWGPPSTNNGGDDDDSHDSDNTLQQQQQQQHWAKPDDEGQTESSWLCLAITVPGGPRWCWLCVLYLIVVRAADVDL